MSTVPKKLRFLNTCPEAGQRSHLVPATVRVRWHTGLGSWHSKPRVDLRELSWQKVKSILLGHGTGGPGEFWGSCGSEERVQGPSHCLQEVVQVAVFPMLAELLTWGSCLLQRRLALWCWCNSAWKPDVWALEGAGQGLSDVPLSLPPFVL